MKKEEKKYIPTKEGLERLYDAINRIAKNYKPEEIDTSKWFISKEELKKDKKNIFI